MKIIFLSSSLAPHFGGAAFSESALAGKLSTLHEVWVLSRVDRMDTEFAIRNGIRSLKGFRPWEVLFAFFSSRHWLCKLFQSADLLHLNGHWFWENYIFARLAQRYGVPYILHPRGMLLVGHRRKKLKKCFNALIGNWIVKQASQVIALSHYEKEQFLPYGLESQRISVIPNPIEMREHQGIEPGSEKYFLYLGRIESRKNLKFLLESFSLFVQTHTDVHLKLVGPVEHAYDQELKVLAKKLTMDNKVEFLGPIFEEEKWRMYAGALAVIYPAVDEPYGRVPFEAMAAGCLAVVPQQSGSAEYLRGEFLDYIYIDGDRESLAQKMGLIYGYSAAKRSKMATQTKQWISVNLNWENILPQFLNIYQAKFCRETRQNQASSSIN